MTYYSQSNTYKCDVCGTTGLFVGQIQRPTATRHECLGCLGEAFAQAPQYYRLWFSTSQAG